MPNLATLLPALIQQFGPLIYPGLFLLIFVETGVVILPFLPGDSLLFLCGALAAVPGQPLNPWLLLGLLPIAAVLGDAANFAIGRRFGQSLPKHPRISRLIKPAYLDRSVAFFARHGKSAIFLGRFVPIIRTFIPFTAGLSRMHYPSFAFYNVLGGVTWVLTVLAAGFWFGNIAVVQSHLELILLAMVLVSLIPAILVSRRGATDEN